MFSKELNKNFVINNKPKKEGEFMKTALLLMLCSLATADLAFAGAAADQKKAGEWTSSYNQNNDDFKTRCGFAVAAALDSKAFLASEFIAKDVDPGGYCKAVIGGLASKCDDATFKAEVAKQVKKVNCVPGKGTDQKLAISGGTLTYTVAPGASNQDAFIDKWLGDNL